MKEAPLRLDTWYERGLLRLEAIYNACILLKSVPWRTKCGTNKGNCCTRKKKKNIISSSTGTMRINVMKRQQLRHNNYSALLIHVMSLFVLLVTTNPINSHTALLQELQVEHSLEVHVAKKPHTIYCVGGNLKEICFLTHTNTHICFSLSGYNNLTTCNRKHI